MNLILSNVEETIMILDADSPDKAINVFSTADQLTAELTRYLQMAKRKSEMLFVRGDGVILVGYLSNLPHDVLIFLPGFSAITVIASASWC